MKRCSFAFQLRCSSPLSIALPHARRDRRLAYWLDPIQVPSPVYFADLAAERAASLYQYQQGVQGPFLGGDFNEEQSLRLFF